MILSEVSQEPVGPKEQPQALDLRQIRSLSAAFGQDRGSLVPTYRKDRDLWVIWKDNLATAFSQGSVSAATADELDALFDAFTTSYTAAVQTFTKVSVSAREIDDQYEA